MEMENTPSNEKIREALELLRQAAVEKKEELRGMVRDQYSDVKDVIGAMGANMSDRAKVAMDNLKNAAQQGQEKVKDAALRVDECVHDKPWHVIGGVAVVALLLGYLMGKKNS